MSLIPQVYVIFNCKRLLLQFVGAIDVNVNKKLRISSYYFLIGPNKPIILHYSCILTFSFLFVFLYFKAFNNWSLLSHFDKIITTFLDLVVAEKFNMTHVCSECL